MTRIEFHTVQVELEAAAKARLAELKPRFA
jgi:hypothetical protein